MKKIIFLMSLVCLQQVCSLSATSDKIDNYLQYFEQYPKALGPLGNFQMGEIEIVTDKNKMAQIETKTSRQVGVVAEDKYWIWINDAVKFPNGSEGVYGRILWRQALKGTVGVAVMPILPDGRIVLNRNFRHATRSWEYELPRGCVNANETIYAAAAREVKEETGMILDELVLLGFMNPDSGMTSSVVPVFAAKVVRQENASPEDSEAIAAIEAFSLDEIKNGYIDGRIKSKNVNNTVDVYLRDPFLTFALYNADARNLVR